MPLFIVHHHRSHEAFLAHDPVKGATLLNHLSRPNAARHGVLIKGEAVAQGSHLLVLIAEAADEAILQAFLHPSVKPGMSM